MIDCTGCPTVQDSGEAITSKKWQHAAHLGMTRESLIENYLKRDEEEAGYRTKCAVPIPREPTTAAQSMRPGERFAGNIHIRIKGFHFQNSRARQQRSAMPRCLLHHPRKCQAVGDGDDGILAYV